MGNVKQLIKDLREAHDWTDASKCTMYEAMMKEASFLIEDMMCEIEDLRAENSRPITAKKLLKAYVPDDFYCKYGERKDIELPIKQKYYRGEIIADELQADGTLIKRTDTIEELNRRIKQMKEQENADARHN